MSHTVALCIALAATLAAAFIVYRWRAARLREEAFRALAYIEPPLERTGGGVTISAGHGVSGTGGAVRLTGGAPTGRLSPRFRSR